MTARREQPFRVAAAAVGWFGLVFQYWLIMIAPLPMGPVGRTVYFFGYLTILTNILAALAMTLPWAAPGSRAARFFLRPSVRTAITSYLIVVGVAFYLLIRPDLFPQARHIVSDVTLHYLVPALFLADWFLFVPRKALRPRQVIIWLAFPSAFGIYILLLGAVFDIYPYPFINAKVIGYWRMGGVIAVFAAGFGVVALTLVAIDRALAARGLRKD